ncbi:MAG TPA: methylenetetrahydrofolate reductase [NAD(P)H] [Geminicoccaceae bacterium]
MICTTSDDRAARQPPGPLPPVRISFELFPPKTEAGHERLWSELDRLRRLDPAYVSVTCGAGGNPAEGTADLVDQLGRRLGVVAAAHLTCASAPRAAVDRIARAYLESGIRHIVALRGDPPKDRRDLGEHYPYAVDLVAAIRRLGDFEISVAAYPETHPQAPSPERDVDNLRAKLEAGAGRAITQYCFETETVLRFRDRVRRAGVVAPIAIGILPISDFTQVRRFSERCGAGVPRWLAERFVGVEEDRPAQLRIGAEIAAEQVTRLIAEGFRQFHFYTLNRAEPTVAACRLLGHPPALASAA